MVLSTDNGGYDWSLLRDGATWHVYTGEASRSTGQSVDVGQWQHIAAVFEKGYPYGVRFYKNGVETVIPYWDWDDDTRILRNLCSGPPWVEMVGLVRWADGQPSVQW